MNLDHYALKHGTDKSSIHHNYTAVYEKYFRPIKEDKVKVLEIGVLYGASLKMWNEICTTYT